MRKLFMVVLFLLVPCLSWGADTITVLDMGSKYNVRQIRWTADSDGADGTISGGQTEPLYGWVIEIKIVPDTTDASWSLQLVDEVSFDWGFANFTTMSTTTVVKCPLDANATYPRLHGERLSVYATGLGTTVGEGFTMYLRIKE